MKKSKKSIIVGITVLLLITLILLGLTYAYYRTRIIGNPNYESISVTSKLLEITYHDGTATSNMTGNIEPGYEYTKEFSVENTWNETASYSIVLDNVANTFTRTGDWTYTLTTGGSEVASGVINRLEIQTVLANISIDSDEITNYTLEVKYNEKNENQSVDMGKSMSFRVNIKDASAWDKAEEGTLLYALRNNNEVVEPLSVPGKAISGVAFTESDGMSSKYSISADYQSSRYYTYSSTYTFDEGSGKYSLVNPQVATYAEVSTNLKDKYVVSYYPNYTGTEMTKGLDIIYKITSAPATSTSSSVTIGYTYKTADAEIFEEALLSSTEDDYGTSYYFRGNVKNNYVNYAGMCWRIVRIAGDGSVKLILDDRYTICDDTEDTDGTGTTDYAYTGNWSDEKTYAFGYDANNRADFLNYTGGLADSLKTFQTTLAKKINTSLTETSTQTEINTALSSKLKIDEWCYDDKVTETESWGYNDDGVYDETLSDMISEYYGAYTRILINKTPSLNCTGTKLTKYKDNTDMYVGTLTADEISFAGEFYPVKRDYYYLMNNCYLMNNYAKDNNLFWYSLSPGFYDSDDMAQVFDESCTLNYASFDDTYYSRPAVSLKSGSVITGGVGTIDDPYVIE